MNSLGRDTLYALRTLRNNPVFTLAAVLILALGLGGDAAMFSVIRAVLLKPLDYPEPDRLVQISGGATPTRYQELKASAQSFTGVGAFIPGVENLTLTSAVEPEVLKGSRVSAGFLRIVGVDPLMGRGFLPDEDSAGGAPVAMLSADLWRSRFAGDPQILGKTIALAGTPYTIIGVLPAHFQFPFPALDVWLTGPAHWPAVPPKSRELSPFLTIFGRLKPGLTLEQASADLAVIHRQYASAHPAMLDAKPKSPERVTPMKDVLVANVRSMLWMLFGAVGCVSLIACANVAALLLARATSRSREFAVRAALGASRTRLIVQLLTESLLLACAGGVLGVLLANWTLRWISHMTAFHLPRMGDIHLDGVVLAFSAGISIATGVFFGLLPSLSASRPNLIGVLRASGAAATQEVRKRVLFGLTARGLLVVGQVALSIVLLIGAALLMESLAHLRGVDLGFNPSNLLTLQVSLPSPPYDTDQKKVAFFEELLRRIGSSPGIRGVTAAWTVPMTGYPGIPVQNAAQPRLRLNERPIAIYQVATPAYFRTLEIPLRRGRDFTAHDRAGTERVAIIDEGLARLFWPAYPAGQDPIGQHLLVGGIDPRPAEIIGIAANVHQNLDNNAWPGSVYVCLAQSPPPFVMLAIRTERDPLRFTRMVREQVLALDRAQPISEVQTMDALVEGEVGQRRLVVMLLGSFAGVALLLALIGIYGVISYSVLQRTHEMGIRRALGAQQTEIMRLIMGQGLRLTLAGVAIGVGAALALTRVMQSLLFHVSTTDPAAFAGIALLFIPVALAASYIPARRATRIDPVAALRV